VSSLTFRLWRRCLVKAAASIRPLGPSALLLGFRFSLAAFVVQQKDSLGSSRPSRATNKSPISGQPDVCAPSDQVAQAHLQLDLRAHTAHTGRRAVAITCAKRRQCPRSRRLRNGVQVARPEGFPGRHFRVLLLQRENGRTTGTSPRCRATHWPPSCLSTRWPRVQFRSTVTRSRRSCRDFEMRAAKTGHPSTTPRGAPSSGDCPPIRETLLPRKKSDNGCEGVHAFRARAPKARGAAAEAALRGAEDPAATTHNVSSERISAPGPSHFTAPAETGSVHVRTTTP